MDDPHFKRNPPATAAAPVMHDSDSEDSTSYEDCYLLEGSEQGALAPKKTSVGDSSLHDNQNHDTGITTTLNDDDDDDDDDDDENPHSDDNLASTEASDSHDKLANYRWEPAQQPQDQQQTSSHENGDVKKNASRPSSLSSPDHKSHSNENAVNNTRRRIKRSVSFEGDPPNSFGAMRSSSSEEGGQQPQKQLRSAMRNGSPVQRHEEKIQNNQLGSGDGGDKHEKHSSSGGSIGSSCSFSDTSQSEESVLLDEPIRAPHAAKELPQRGVPRQYSGRRAMAMQALKIATQSVKSNMCETETYNFNSVVRETRKVDMETGVKATREFTAQRIKDPEFWTPMNPQERRKKILMRKTKENLNPEIVLNTSRHKQMNLSSRGFSIGTNRKKLDLDDEVGPQYRLRSMIEKNDHTFMKSSFNIVREYLYWCFRKTFLMVVVTESVIFLLWCWGFALVYYWIGRFNPTCILTQAGYNFEEADMGFIDMFTLSWNTFSTVGYGHVHPAVHGEGSACIFVSVLASLQSFIGVLSASLCSAIIFSKIARSQSVAHVIFSDTVVIRFGQELMQSPANVSTRNINNHNSFTGQFFDDNTGSVTRYPCPILEFRIVNLLHDEKGGEILNCKLNVVSSTLQEVSVQDTGEGDVSRASFFGVLSSKEVVRGMMRTLKDVSTMSASTRSGVGPVRTGGSIIQKVNRSITDFTAAHNIHTLDSSGSIGGDGAEALPYKEEEAPVGVGSDVLNDSYDLSVDEQEILLTPTGKISRPPERRKKRPERMRSVCVDEEPGDGEKPASKRIFAKLDLETDSHPFLKRVWNIRHKLTQDSPLLTEDARDLIRLNMGLWPVTLCNLENIKKCLDLSQLIVTLNGTNVASGSSVYKLHVYGPDSVMVGRTFENPLKLGPDGKLMIDMGLVHTTKPQHGGNESDGEGDS